MAYDEKGKLGSLDIRLAHTVEPDNRYRRDYVPVTPKSQEIPGADAKIAPEDTVATWAISDWSAGEGDLRWKDRDQYNISDGLSPASDGSGLVAMPLETETQESGAGDFTDGLCISSYTYVSIHWVYAASDASGYLYKWNTSTEVWDQSHAIGGTGTSNIDSLCVTPSYVYLSTNSQLYRILPGVSSSAFGGVGYEQLGMFASELYGVRNGSLYSIDTVTGAYVQEYDTLLAGNGMAIYRQMAMSDVGPVWANYAGWVFEFNVAEQTGSVVGRLPYGATAANVYWSRDTYYCGFNLGFNTSGYLWFKAPTGEGVIGPIRNLTGTAYSQVNVAGEVGDRIIFNCAGGLWAYDQSDGAVVLLREMSLPETLGYAPCVAFSDEVMVRGNEYTSPQVMRYQLDKYETAAASLDTGRYDFGYLGLNKILTSVTVTTEGNAGSDTVQVAYSVDGGSFTTLSGSLTGANSRKTWTVSSNATTVKGIDFEFRITTTPAASTSCVKVVQLVAQCIGAESRIEWTIPIDLSDNNRQHGNAVLQGLKALKTTPVVQELTDPWQSLSYDSPETFDVTVEEVRTPMEHPGGERYAVVRLRSVGTVGGG